LPQRPRWCWLTWHHADLYHAFLETPVELKVGALEINKNMLLWINDALMAVFFLLVGLRLSVSWFWARLPAASARRFR
jgi:Na+/H+ antiporter NhaA